MSDQADGAEIYRTPPRYPIESVANALKLLTLFVQEDRIRVKDAADHLGVAPGTAHRLLAMLQYHGFLSRDPVTRVYLPGPVLLSLALRRRQSDLQRAARPHLERLSAELDETVHLATLYGYEVLFVDGVESTKALRVSVRTGALYPAHLTSVGKALLAELPDERLAKMYPADPLPSRTPQSTATRASLWAQLAEVRRSGLATNFGELEDGIHGVAAAVHTADDRAAAAVAVVAPESRGVDVEAVVPRLRACVDAIGRALDAL